MKITLDLTHLEDKPFLLSDLIKIIEQHKKRPTEIVLTKKQATYMTLYNYENKEEYWHDFRGIPLKII